MKWKGRRQSDNYSRRTSGRSGGRGRKAGGISIGGIIIGLVLWLVFDMSPMTAFQTGQSVNGATNSVSNNVNNTSGKTVQNSNGYDDQFIKTVLADTEDVWTQIFQASGKHYKQPKFVAYDGSTMTACGNGLAATGPFYCPADQTIYLDTTFFTEMSQKMGITGDQQAGADIENRGRAGDFAQAYVIAHEVGHHVQTITGISSKIRQAQKQANSKATINDLSVRQELQADCFAGVWANHNQKRTQFLEQGDIDEGMNASSMIGDDRLAKNSGRVVVPDNFTHGSSQQRVKWFKRGLTSGDINQCDTFVGSI